MAGAQNITFEHVYFGYDGSPILKDVSFSVGASEHLAVKGGSGTGKTTIFRLLMGFAIPDRGTIRVGDTVLSEETAASIRQQTAWLPQDLNMGEGTVREVLLFPFQFKANLHNKPDSEKLEDILTRLGLDTSLPDKPFKELSTGQRQRVGIALCHLLGKPILLLDEPTSALDTRSKQHALDLLLSRPGRTILSTSHDPFWITQCDRVYSLDL